MRKSVRESPLSNGTNRKLRLSGEFYRKAELTLAQAQQFGSSSNLLEIKNKIHCHILCLVAQDRGSSNRHCEILL